MCERPENGTDTDGVKEGFSYRDALITLILYIFIRVSKNMRNFNVSTYAQKTADRAYTSALSA